MFCIRFDFVRHSKVLQQKMVSEFVDLIQNETIRQNKKKWTKQEVSQLKSQIAVLGPAASQAIQDLNDTACLTPEGGTKRAMRVRRLHLFQYCLRYFVPHDHPNSYPFYQDPCVGNWFDVEWYLPQTIGSKIDEREAHY